MPRTTQSTVQALERLCEAADLKLERDGKSFVVRYPKAEAWGLPPVGKTSARALALAVSSVRHREDWPAIQAATAYDPGWMPGKSGDPPTLSIPEMMAWEELELALLAEPFNPYREET